MRTRSGSHRHFADTSYRHAEGSFDAAEPHLLAAGKRDSARILAETYIEWAGPEGPVGAFALRGTIP